MSHAQTILNAEPPVPAAKGTVGAVGNQTSYNPGLSYLVGPALYELMKIWSDISVLYQKLVTSVTDSTINFASANAKFQIQQGVDARNAAFTQGFTEAFGGLVIGGTGFASDYMLENDSELQSLQTEKEGLNGYQESLNKAMDEGSVTGFSEMDDEAQEELKAAAKTQMDDLLNQESFAGSKPTKEGTMVRDEKGNAKLDDETTMRLAEDRDQTRLKEHYQQKSRDIDTKIQGRIQELNRLENNRMIKAQAGQALVKGGGQAGSGFYTEAQKDDESKSTMAQANQQVAQGIDSHFRGQVDKMVEAAVQAITTLAAISRANTANS